METPYNPQSIEQNAQHFWAKNHCFNVHETTDKPKFYCLSMFPYPSGRLHMGHVRNYTIGDVIARYQRMLGKNVLQPIGWDAFGLPAENAAIAHRIPPAEWTTKNIAYMRTQLTRLGFAYDFDREIATNNPSYYRWEQWFFLQLYAKGLVYKKNAAVNWDPVDQTILANEQVVNGRGWRSGALVERREIPQWFLRITAYADALLNDLNQLEHWPEQVKTMQRNWIGRSVGAQISFQTDAGDAITIFTTRPDTVCGATYLALAPEHPVAKKAAQNQPALQTFLDECRNVKVAEAELATLPKKGMPTGFMAIHPMTQAAIPIWVANFVVLEYGSGAVMAVPAHDQRDFEFAKQYAIPLKPVILPQDGRTWDYTEKAFTEPGQLIHSDPFNGLDSATACNAIIDYLEARQQGKREINYRLRDWSISRQRYWGTPIPIINCPHCGPVPAKDLPVVLPENVQFEGVISPLKSIQAFFHTTCPHCGIAATRETDTFDTFFESSWYYARFACYNQEQAMLDKRADYWVPVDQYIGGIEHAVMHLLYARFMHKLMRDEGLLHSDEPFTRLLTQGMVLNQGIKMSKSKGNTVDPQSLIEQYGADTVRLFIIFAAPPDQSLEWSDSGVEGSHRFLKRLWAFACEYQTTICDENDHPRATWENGNSEQRDTLRQLYEILAQAQYDYDRLQFNTVVSGSMKLFNLLAKIATTENDKKFHAFILQHGTSILLRLLAPIAPHITHQLWQDLHYPGHILDAAWPETQAHYLKTEEIELVVQINGKLRSRIRVPSDAETKTIENIAMEDAKVKQTIALKKVKKIITVPGRLVNFVVEEK